MLTQTYGYTNLKKIYVNSVYNWTQFALQVHRRILNDDGKGVGEALNEEEFGQGLVARGQHYLILGSTELTNDGKLKWIHFNSYTNWKFCRS